MTEKDAARFWSKVNKDGPVPSHMPHLGKCHVWTACANGGGYGRFLAGGVNRHAHRVAWAMKHGTPPDGMCVLHHCDNPPCVKAEADADGPAHLFLGTKADNKRDCIAKGRMATGDKSGARLHPESRPRGDNHPFRMHPELVVRGERHPRSRLTEQDVDTIRKCYATGLFSHARLASAFSVGKSTVGALLLGKSWKPEWMVAS